MCGGVRVCVVGCEGGARPALCAESRGVVELAECLCVGGHALAAPGHRAEVPGRGKPHELAHADALALGPALPGRARAPAVAREAAEVRLHLTHAAEPAHAAQLGVQVGRGRLRLSHKEAELL